MPQQRYVKRSQCELRGHGDWRPGPKQRQRSPLVPLPDSALTLRPLPKNRGATISCAGFERPYYLGIGDKHGAEGYVVIRDALRNTGKVGLGQVTVAGREWLVAVAPLGDGLGMTMLRYGDELRDPADFFDEVPGDKPDKEMVDLAVELIERKSGSFKPDEFENHYHTALKELVDEKLKGLGELPTASGTSYSKRADHVPRDGASRAARLS